MSGADFHNCRAEPVTAQMRGDAVQRAGGKIKDLRSPDASPISALKASQEGSEEAQQGVASSWTRSRGGPEHGNTQAW